MQLVGVKTTAVQSKFMNMTIHVGIVFDYKKEDL